MIISPRPGVLLMVFFLCFSVASPYYFSEACATGERELFSISSLTNGHVGAPERYQWKLCSSGEVLTLSDSCDDESTPIGGLNDPTGFGGHLFLEETPETKKLCANTLYWYASTSC